MVQALLGCQPLLGILEQQHRDEVLGLERCLLQFGLSEKRD